MAIAVEMPKMSDTMEEGVLVAWQAEEGDDLSAGDIIAQVETDKATMDLEVYDDGVLLKKVINEGDAVPIGGLIAILGEKGEDVSDILAEYGGEKKGAEGREEDDRSEGEGETEGEAEENEQENEDAPAETVQVPGGNGAQRASQTSPKEVAAAGDERLKSSPLARRMAREHNIELARLHGSGPEGRIIKRDVEAAIEEGAAAPARDGATAYQESAGVTELEPKEHFETQSISQMRKTIARRLADSKYTSPHFYLTVDVDVENAVAAREELNRVGEARGTPRLSFNDLITKACALALRQHPDVNASYHEEAGEIRRYSHVHVAVAVAIDEGLVTPVIRHADRKGLVRIAAETRDLAGRARERKLQPKEWEGSTFTTSNLGMYGIEEFTAIINPPNSCILAIGVIRDVPVVKNNDVVAGRRMKLTLSCDHRLVDGATGAEFLQTVQQFLENPVTMLL
jgi:pyruvate dehydrogenase E2 component (dihydrolipoamide acetyltransferase)